MFRWWQAAAVFAVVGPANAAELSLQRIMLSSGGVGYFEHEAVVDGNATLSLDVPLDQVDDILKSLVVYDDAGTAGEVTLPGREPLTQAFGDLPFDRAALDSAPALLNALQGAEVRVAGAKPMSGRLLRVVEETARGADGLTIPRDRVPSRPGELHPEPLTDPDLILSHHPARAPVRRLPPFRCMSGSSRCRLPDPTSVTRSLRSTGITPASSLLRSSPPLSGASVLSASRLEPLAPFPLASPVRFS